MSKVQMATAVLRQLVRQPGSLKHALYDVYEASMQRYVVQTYGLPHGLPVIDLLELFPNLDETITPYSFLEGQASPTDLALLKGLARRTAPCTYLEIGSWRGESLANVAAVAERCVSISLSAAELRAMGMPEDFIRTHNVYAADLPNVRHIGHNSHTFDYAALGERFDLVFVDGDHRRAGVTADTRQVFPLLRDDRSAIVWHDYGYSPESIRWSVLAGILDGCPPAARGRLYQVSNTVCAVYLRGTFKTTRNKLYQIPNKVFDLHLTARKRAPDADSAG